MIRFEEWGFCHPPTLTDVDSGTVRSVFVVKLNIIVYSIEKTQPCAIIGGKGMQSILRFLTVCAICFISLPAAAQVPENGVPGIPYGNPETFAEFHGFVDLVYRNVERDAPNTKEGGRKTFDQKGFYFNAIARLRQDLTIYSELEYEHGGEEFKLDRAILEWKYRDRGKLKLGKFYAPFGLEVLEYQSPVRRLVSRPFMVDDLLFHEWTEVGFKIFHDFPDLRIPFNYELALVNGPAGLRKDDRQNHDNNDQPFVIGRITAKPHESLTLGVSYAGGEYDQAGTKEVKLVGFEANLRWEGLDLRGEVVRRSGDNQDVVESTISAGPTAGDPAARLINQTMIPADASGYYVQAAYAFFFDRHNLHYIEPVLRYDVRDPDRGADNNQDQSRWALGLNVAPMPHFVVKIEYDWTREQHGNALKNNGLLIQVVADF